MKIAWFTPFSRTSAIGMVGRRVAEELAAKAEVTIWTADPPETLLDTKLRVIPFVATPEAAVVVREYDAAVYHFGDSYPFHREIYLMSQMVPGVAVLHDFVMHHFFAAHFLDALRSVEAYRERLEAFYGDEGRRAFEACFTRTDDGWDVEVENPLWTTDEVIRFPFFEEALRGAVGAVVHADFFRERVERVAVAPVRRLHLPRVQSQPAAETLTRDQLGIPQGRAVLLTVGVVNRNKQAHAIVEALAQHRDVAARVFYALVGLVEEGEYTQSLRAAIRRYGLTDSVRLLGRRSDQELSSWLEHADICINLRNPVMEGASGSLADQFMQGKAVIVSDDGVFAEIPDECARKIRPGREAQDAAALIARLLDNPDERLAMAYRARAYAEKRFRPDRYAAQLLEFLQELEGTTAMMRFADNLGATLRQMGVVPGMPIAKKLADEASALFGDPVSSPWRLGGA